MVCLKKEFKSKTKIDKFNAKTEEFYVLGLWLKIFKDKKGLHICVNKKELHKIYQKFGFFQENIVTTTVLKTVLFVKDLDLFI